VLKVTKNNLTLIVPSHWIDSRGFLKVSAVYAIKLFFGDKLLKAVRRNGNTDGR